MYSYEWDEQTGGYILNTTPLEFSKEPRPVYYKELDILGYDKKWKYPKSDVYPLLWAESNNYYYRGRLVAKTKGGSIYHAPEIIFLDDPEPNGDELRFVDIPAMVEKNREILESLTQETIKKIYNIYLAYQKKVDIFYVAFSGGKDSIVTLDLVQRALPHNAFKVLFGDTKMEFPDTYKVVEQIKKYCMAENIDFLRAASEFDPKYTWEKIGPPAQKMRWCCSVHKTAPQILLLRQYTNNPHFRGMAIMGVRADESIARSKYEQLNLGTKHKGQYDFYPILYWNSAELFLYIYQEKLIINETYKKGNSRAGCLVCPMEAVKNTWFKEQSYKTYEDKSQTTTFFNEIILDKTIAKYLPESNKKEYMDIGVWKSRHNGKKLASPENLFFDEYKDGVLSITLTKISTEWREWIKTIGSCVYLSENEVEITYENKTYLLEFYMNNGFYVFKIKIDGSTKNDILFMSYIKVALKRAAYCITCHICEVNCPHGYIRMENGKVLIDNKCLKCKLCYKVSGGCVVAESQMLPKEAGNMTGSIDRYKNMGIRYSWLKEYFRFQNDFWINNELGSMMITALKSFLQDAKMVDKKYQLNDFGKLLISLGIDNPTTWGLMLCNLAYTSQFGWWIKNVNFNIRYTENQLKILLERDVVSENSIKNIISGFKFILYTNSVLANQVGLGECSCDLKGKNLILLDVCRKPWADPDPKVILYSLYKFSEACGDYKQFTLTRLLNHEIESDGISPTQIFGLDRKTMERILSGLANNYPDFISVSFTLDLDNINLKDKTSEDVLSLFDGE